MGIGRRRYNQRKCVLAAFGIGSVTREPLWLLMAALKESIAVTARGQATCEANA